MSADQTPFNIYQNRVQAGFQTGIRPEDMPLVQTDWKEFSQSYGAVLNQVTTVSVSVPRLLVYRKIYLWVDQNIQPVSNASIFDIEFWISGQRVGRKYNFINATLNNTPSAWPVSWQANLAAHVQTRDAMNMTLNGTLSYIAPWYVAMECDRISIQCSKVLAAAFVLNGLIVSSNEKW